MRVGTGPASPITAPDKAVVSLVSPIAAGQAIVLQTRADAILPHDDVSHKSEKGIDMWLG